MQSPGQKDTASLAETTAGPAPQPDAPVRERIADRQRIPSPQEGKPPEISLDINGRPSYARKIEAPSALSAVGTAAMSYALAEMTATEGTERPAQQVMRYGYTALTIARMAKHHFDRGHRIGQQVAKREHEASAYIRLSDLRDPGPQTTRQLITDLVALSANGKTTLDPNRRLAPEMVAERATRMILAGGPFRARLHLPELGIRPTPNLIDALQNYTRGGRKQLTHAGLVEKDTHIEAYMAGFQTSPAGKDRDADHAKAEKSPPGPPPQQRSHGRANGQRREMEM